ncbi:MAG: hypothetical protein ACYTBS_15815 [Planctomycetota bacterium]|jgi:hypothetical protein
MSLADTLIHVDEELSEAEREKIVARMREIPGVISPRFNPGKEHMLSVAFDPEGLRSTELLENVKGMGYHAKLIGL